MKTVTELFEEARNEGPKNFYANAAYLETALERLESGTIDTVIVETDNRDMSFCIVRENDGRVSANMALIELAEFKQLMATDRAALTAALYAKKSVTDYDLPF